MADGVKVYNKLSDNAVEFETKEDFNKYYQTHKDEIDGMATRGLNLKYRIVGHKIGRKGGKIVLYPIKNQNYLDIPSARESPQEPREEVIQRETSYREPAPKRGGMSIDEKLNNLNQRLKQVEQAINEIFEELDSNK